MTIDSDLDLIVIYHAEKGVFSDGLKSVSAQVYYSRLTQAFISAITVPTAEGSLFKVDMRLRPSGNSGPIATSVNSFENYQENEAWVWERLALSRGRVLSGSSIIQQRIKKIIVTVLVSEIGDMQVVKQVSEMRQRLSKNINKSSTLYEIKLGVGRLQDLELLIQMGSLLHKNFRIISPYLMIRQLHELNFFSESEAKICEETYVLYSALQQILSLTVNLQCKITS